MIHACCFSVIIVMEMYFILLVQMRNLRWLDTVFRSKFVMIRVPMTSELS